MKNYIIALSAICLLSLNLNAQHHEPEQQVATFEDGTKISYNVLENSGDNQFANTIAGFNQADDRNIGCLTLMYAHLNPDKFYAHGELGFMLGAGLGGINVGGTYFLGASEKDYTLPISIRSHSDGQTTTRYVIKTPAIKNRHYGVNFEAGFKRYNVTLSDISTNNRSYELTSLSTGEIAIGFGYLTTKEAMLKVDNKSYMGGSHLFHLTTDLMVYPGTKFAYTTSDSASASVPLVADDFLGKKVGFRVMIKGQTSFKYNKKSDPQNNFGFYYRLGVMKSIYASPSGVALTTGISLIAGLGFFCSF